MIVFDGEPEMSSSSPDEIRARALLAICAVEMRRQAQALAELDVALGVLLQVLRAPSALPSGDGALPSSVMRDLQRADHARQEVAGLAKALDLLVGVGSLDEAIPSDLIRACSPVIALQNRLLAVASDDNLSCNAVVFDRT